MTTTSIGQLFTLIGVALGAVLSYFARSLADRAGFRHDLGRRWEERKLDAYAQYVNDVKQVGVIARGIAGTRGLHVHITCIPLSEGIPLLDEAEARREQSTELLTLLAGRKTITAYRLLNRAVGRLEWFARGTPPDVEANEWEQAFKEYERAFDLFYVCVRTELGVPEEYLPRDRTGDISPEAWVKEVRSRRDNIK
jgi:hypothetical protein